MKLDVPDLDSTPLPGEPLGVEFVEARVHGEPEVRTTKAGDGKYLAIQWDIFAPEEVAGRCVFSNHSLSPKAKGFLKALLVTLGIGFDETGFDTTDMIGCGARLHIKQQEYEGKMSDNVSEVLPLES